MTGICAFIDNQGGAARARVDTMLASMIARGTSLRSVTSKIGKIGEVGMGICSLSERSTRFRREGDRSLVLDGTFLGDNSERGLDPSDSGPIHKLFNIPGAFSFLGFNGQELFAGRDQLGQKPLYWATDEHGNCAFASLKVPLKNAGMPDPKPVPPGQLVTVSERGYATSANDVLTKPQPHDISEAEALDQLERLLLESVHEMVPDESALAFSGGLDSTLVATACKKAGLGPKLVTVGLAGQSELEHAELAASSIGLQTHIKRLSRDDVMNALANVVRTIESDSPVTVGISVPFYFACQQARKIEASAIVAGQLSDELFGGYARFEKLVLEGGVDKAEDAMWESVLAASTGDFEPGDKLAVSFGLELRCPFAYLPLVNQALQLPLDLRLKVAENGVTRKYILRKLAQRWGLPASVANRPKKAFQYSSGVQKVLKKEARRSGQSLGELLSSLAQT